MYAVYSRFFADDPDWSAVDTVKLLLSRGADPNAGFLWRGLVPPFTALTGAFGGGENHQPWHPQRLVVGRLLLEAGADPNDGQLLYNNGIGGQNHDDPSHLELLVEFGLGTQNNGPWYQRLGEQLRDPAELLYDEVEAAAKRNRPTILKYLSTLGLDLNRPIGRSQLTPTRIAAAEGHVEILAVLADVGLNTELTPPEIALGHTRNCETSELENLIRHYPRLLAELQATYPGLCVNVAADHASMLEFLIELGFDINDRSDTKTPLHHAAESNDVDRARLLIEHGADPNLVDTYIGAPPWGWADHFGHIETAAYLHPLTHHGDPLPEITIRHAKTLRTLATPELIEGLLDRTHREASQPVLVRLEAAKASLTIGLGNPDFSVALHLDAGGTAWYAMGDPSLVRSEPISFANPDNRHVYDFNPTAAIGVDAARTVARDFCRDPSNQPQCVNWTIEGIKRIRQTKEEPT